MLRLRAISAAAAALAFPAASVVHADVVALEWVALGENEVPPVVSDGFGYGVIFVDDVTGEFTLTGSFVDMTSDVTVAHIHGPAEIGENAGVLVGLVPEGDTAGRVTGSGTLSADDLAEVLAGRTYVNIHSVDNPSGELRGQILDGGPVNCFAWTADGTQENPPIDTPATGEGSLYVNPASGNFALAGDFRDLRGDVTVAHIHGPAEVGENAGVLVGLVPIGTTEGFVTGAGTIDAGTLASIDDGLTYVNIHSTFATAGEIRGQQYDLEQTAPTPGTAGTNNTLVARGGAPGETTTFAYALAAGSTPIPGCGGVTADLGNPVVAGSAVADLDGTARLTLFVPGAAAGRTVFIQSVELATCTVSNLVEVTID